MIAQNGMAAGADAELDRRAREGERWERMVADREDAMRSLCAQSIKDAEKFLLDHDEDPAERMAKVLRLACTARLSDDTLGGMVREMIVGPLLRVVAEREVERTGDWTNPTE